MTELPGPTERPDDPQCPNRAYPSAARYRHRHRPRPARAR